MYKFDIRDGNILRRHIDEIRKTELVNISGTTENSDETSASIPLIPELPLTADAELFSNIPMTHNQNVPLEINVNPNIQANDKRSDNKHANVNKQLHLGVTSA